MANRIKGITIQIGADTSELSKDFAKINGELAKTGNALKDVNKLLKLDPKNTELLAQKQSLLTKQIEQSTSKLTDLKQKLDDINSGKATVSNGSLDALKREIESTKISIDNLKKAQADLGSETTRALAGAGQAWTKYGEKIKGVGVSLTKTVTAPILGVGTAAVAAFTEVDAAQDILIAKTGASGQALSGMQSIAENLATTIPTSFENAANAVGEVNTRFGLVGAELEVVSGKFIKFASINKTDVGGAIDEVSRVMRAFNLEAQDAGRTLDILNVAGQAMGGDLNKVTSALGDNAGAFRALGMNLEQSVAFMKSAGEAGLDVTEMVRGLSHAYNESVSATAGAAENVEKYKAALADADAALESAQYKQAAANAAYREAAASGKASESQLIKLAGAANDANNAVVKAQNKVAEVEKQLASAGTATSKTFKDSMAELVIFMNGTASVEEKQAAAAEVFGAKAGAAWANAFINGKLSADMFAQSLDGVDMSVQETFDAIAKNNLDGALTLAFNQLKLLLKEIGAEIMPVLLEALKTLGEKIKEAKTWWQGLDDSTKKSIVTFAAILAAVGPVIVAIGSVVSAIGSIFTAASGLVTFILPALNAIGAGVMGIVSTIGAPLLLAIAALSAALYVIYKNWDDICKWASVAWESFKETVNAGKDSIAEGWNSLITRGSEIFSAVGDVIVNAFTSAYESVKSTLSNMLDSVTNAVNRAIDKIKSLLSFESKAGSWTGGGLNATSVKWHADAMKTGTILTSPTVFNYGGSLHGAGEAGAEAVVGVSSLKEMITSAVQAAAGVGNVTVPVYVGNDKLAEYVVKAGRRTAIRTGGR